MRIGYGYDAHRFVPGKRLVLGGVEIEHDHGLLAHSDGDVLIHAVCDALLGAAGLGDIGRHFPDSDPAYQGIDSRLLLRQVRGQLAEMGLAPVNLDATIVAQAPKLATYIETMRIRIGADLRLNADRVNVKATTTEGMGFAGRGEGIAVHAIVLLEG